MTTITEHPLITYWRAVNQFMPLSAPATLGDVRAGIVAQFAAEEAANWLLRSRVLDVASPAWLKARAL